MIHYGVIYTIVAFLGVIFYNYMGYLKYAKPTKELYDLSKFLGTLLKGGLTSVVIVGISFWSSGFNGLFVFLSFVMGVLFSAGWDKIIEMTSNKKV